MMLSSIITDSITIGCLLTGAPMPVAVHLGCSCLEGQYIMQVRTRFWNFDKADGRGGSTTVVPLLGGLAVSSALCSRTWGV